MFEFILGFLRVDGSRSGAFSLIGLNYSIKRSSKRALFSITGNQIKDSAFTPRAINSSGITWLRMMFMHDYPLAINLA